MLQEKGGMATMQVRWAIFAVSAMLLAALAILPFARTEAPQYAGFLPFIVWGAVFNQLATAYMLSRQLRSTGIRALAALSSAYVCSALLTLGYMATFPTQTAVFLGVAWHYAFPLLVIVYVLALRRAESLSRTEAYALSRRVPLAVGTASLAIVVIAVTMRSAIPVLAINGDYSQIISNGAAPGAALCIVLAFALLWRRTRLKTVMNLWLGVSLFALLLDVLLTIYTGHFYRWGWYLARLDGVLAASFLFIALMEEAGRLGSTVADAQRKLHAVFDSVADAILTIDARDIIVSCNHAAAMLFDITEERLAGMVVTRIIPDYIVAIDTIPGTSTVEVRGQRSDGSIFPLEIAASSANDQGHVVTIVIARDITARKRAETALATARDQALETARLKAQFLATMSHEIRTPINAIVGMSELLRGTTMTDEQREYADTVYTSAESLLAVINDILDFSKLEAGKMQLDSVAFSPLSIVESMADILASQARRKGLSMVTYVAADVPRAVAGDANRLKQILLNLISNAVKFTENGNVVTRCVVERREGDLVTLEFSVSDTGIGLNEATKARLFTPFTQADGSTSRQFGGTGLGLSIVKRLVEIMGGSISVESSEGQGATFSFTAQFAQLTGDLQAAPEQTQIVVGSSALIVDDDKVSRDILMRYLASWGIAADVASNASEALDLLKGAEENQTQYNFAIIDYVMPNVDGITLGRDIHKLPGYESLPIILITAFDEGARGKDAVDAGFAGYLRKPMRQSSLYDAIAVATAQGKLPPHPPVPADPLAEAAAPRADAKGRILLAEDHPVNQKLALKQLQKLGYEASAVDDGQGAVNAVFSEDKYDLVLMDCQMPVVDGFEATRLIRKREMRTGAHIPIIAMTANAMEGDRETCLAAGMDDYIAKPVQIQTLRTLLERWTNALETQHR